MTGIAEEAAALSSRQRSTLRSRLIEDREATAVLVARLMSDIASFQDSVKDSVADDEHDPEGPTLAFERSQSTAILGQTRDHLVQIDSALARLDDGSYGVCSTCARPIPIARLEVRPYSTQCVTCAGKMRR
ncbi:MAG: DNA-binding protein [Microbacteriaceae bacterium]|jgi:DnaK suppressor protein|nr:DNA-binding protein [Microbacteriaceae bacterium]